ncbi:hypothetical protein KJ605_02225 [Patescibacteria group bacterium]|nr:hypothetical protein [Patescibacteria group bacterium]MBU1970569.1 hypothetical protein [Patescibacteria group bacterium]
MVIGLLATIWRFKSHFSHTLLVLSVLVGFSFVNTSRVYATRWFAVAGGGVLSGKTSSTGIQDNAIPSSGLPADFNSDVVQRSGSADLETFGTLISSAGQDVHQTPSGNTNDVYLKNGGQALALTLPFPPAGENLDITPVSNCNNMLRGSALQPMGSSAPFRIYTTTVSCLNIAISQVVPATGYNLNGSGLVVLFVSRDGSNTININRNLISSAGDDERLLVITNANVRVQSTVGGAPATLTFDSPAHVQMGFLALGTVNVDNGGLAVILEGPLMGNGDVTLWRNIASSYPGVFVKYNPLYTAFLAQAFDDAFKVGGLHQTKYTWRYE